MKGRNSGTSSKLDQQKDIGRNKSILLQLHTRATVCAKWWNCMTWFVWCINGSLAWWVILRKFGTVPVRSVDRSWLRGWLHTNVGWNEKDLCQCGPGESTSSSGGMWNNFVVLFLRLQAVGFSCVWWHTQSMGFKVSSKAGLDTAVTWPLAPVFWLP